MSAESLASRAFRAVLPDFLVERMVSTFSNNPDYLKRLEKEFQGAATHELSPCLEPGDLFTFELPDKDGYRTRNHGDSHVSVHFLVRGIQSRKDLIEVKDRLGFYRLSGVLVFAKEASDLFLKGIRVLPLNLKVQGLRTEFIQFADPLTPLSLHIYGLEDPIALANARLLLRDIKNRDNRFVVKLLTEQNLPQAPAPSVNHQP